MFFWYKLEVFDLGGKILTTTFFSILMVGAVDIFIEWYRTFLIKRGANPHFSVLLRRLTFVILAFVFWRSLVDQLEPGEFAATHFFFALFVYCFYRLVSSFYKGKGESS